MLTEAFCEEVPESDINKFLKDMFSKCMNVPIDRLDDEESFFSLGLTSLIHAEIMNNLTRSFGELSGTVLFEYPNFRLLARHLAETKSHPRDERSQRCPSR